MPSSSSSGTMVVLLVPVGVMSARLPTAKAVSPRDGGRGRSGGGPIGLAPKLMTPSNPGKPFGTGLSDRAQPNRTVNYIVRGDGATKHPRTSLAPSLLAV